MDIPVGVIEDEVCDVLCSEDKCPILLQEMKSCKECMKTVFKTMLELFETI